MAARSLERESREVRPRSRAGGIVLAVLEILRARGAGEDVIARIVFVRARLVVEGSTVVVLCSFTSTSSGWFVLLLTASST